VRFLIVSNFVSALLILENPLDVVLRISPYLFCDPQSGGYVLILLVTTRGFMMEVWPPLVAGPTATNFNKFTSLLSRTSSRSRQATTAFSSGVCHKTMMLRRYNCWSDVGF